MTIQGPPICYECAHFHADDIENFGCDAFPRSIPMEIITGDADHHEPYPGDNGIQFEPVKEHAA